MDRCFKSNQASSQSGVANTDLSVYLGQKQTDGNALDVPFSQFYQHLLRPI